MLTINTRPPAARRIGGGLDDPQPPTPRSHRGRLPTPGRERHPSPAPVRPVKRQASTRRAKRADTASPAKQVTPSPPPETTPLPAPAAAISLVAATDVELKLDDGQAVADELAVVRAELAALVPAGDGVTTVRLARMVVTKLAGHGAHCALAINPPRGSLTIDDARTRCLAALDALRPVERHAVLSLITADIREATR